MIDKKLLNEFPFLEDLEKEHGNLGTIRVRAIPRSDIGKAGDWLNRQPENVGIVTSQYIYIEPSQRSKGKDFLVNLIKVNHAGVEINTTIIFKIKEAENKMSKNIYEAKFQEVKLGRFVEVNGEVTFECSTFLDKVKDNGKGVCLCLDDYYMLDVELCDGKAVVKRVWVEDEIPQGNTKFDITMPILGEIAVGKVVLNKDRNIRYIESMHEGRSMRTQGIIVFTTSIRRMEISGTNATALIVIETTAGEYEASVVITTNEQGNFITTFNVEEMTRIDAELNEYLKGKGEVKKNVLISATIDGNTVELTVQNYAGRETTYSLDLNKLEVKMGK